MLVTLAQRGLQTYPQKEVINSLHTEFQLKVGMPLQGYGPCAEVPAAHQRQGQGYSQGNYNY